LPTSGDPPRRRLKSREKPRSPSRGHPQGEIIEAPPIGRLFFVDLGSVRGLPWSRS
jgi:hypothetical protein